MKAVIDTLTDKLFENAAIQKISGEAARDEFTLALKAALTDALYPKSGFFRTRTAILPNTENHLQALAGNIPDSLIGFSINGSTMSAANKSMLPVRIQLGVESYLKKPEKEAHAAASSSTSPFQQEPVNGNAKESEIFAPFEKKATANPATAVSKLIAERAKPTQQKSGGYGSFQ